MKKKAINRLEKAKNAHDWGESHEDKDSEASVARNSTGEPCHAWLTVDSTWCLGVMLGGIKMIMFWGWLADYHSNASHDGSWKKSG